MPSPPTPSPKLGRGDDARGAEAAPTRPHPQPPLPNLGEGAGNKCASRGEGVGGQLPAWAERIGRRAAGPTAGTAAWPPWSAWPARAPARSTSEATITRRSTVARAAVGATPSGRAIAGAALSARPATTKAAFSPRWAVALWRTVAALPPRRAPLEATLATLVAVVGAYLDGLSAWLEQGAAREVDAALSIDLGHQHGHLVADVDHVFDARHPVVGQLRDVDQALFAGQDLHERAEGHEPGDPTRVDAARLDVLGESLDPVDRLLGVLRTRRADQDGPVVVDVDRTLGLFDDLADHLAAGTDHVADAVRVDVDLGDARRVFG